MEFPHLSDTQFPHVDNIDVYKYQNNFQYERWQGKVSFKLLNVLWNSNYADVPYFDTDAKRDEWFDAQHGYVGTLESLFNNTPENTVKIPIPYNDAYNYNYLVVDMPIQTSEAQPINYEDKNIRVKRWFYFIEDMVQTAPSTTELHLAVDYWTTFINSVEIPYLMLERGHAPMSKTTVEQFLANPIANNEYLLADDFNYGNESIIQTSIYKPIGNGKKYVLFCAPIVKDDFALLDGTPYSGNSTPPTYSDINNRWGYQLQVNDYEWKYGDTDYTNSNLPITNQIQTGILNGCECYAIDSVYAKEFFNYCAKYCVHLIHAIKAMFILDEDLFSRSNQFTFKGYTLYIADRNIHTTNFNFNKATFGFDSKYANIAKLYTSPYSTIEITDDEGNTFSAKIENCGNIQMHDEVSLVYPFLNYNVFFSGINGDGTMNYVWRGVEDNTVNKQMWASDFSKFMMNWNIPTYELYVSAENEYAANNFFNVKAKRAGAIKDYENAVRYANTTYENTDDSFDTMQTNVAATGQTNTDNVGRTGATNTENTKRTTTKDVGNVNRTQAGLIDNKNDLKQLRIDNYHAKCDGSPNYVNIDNGFINNAAALNVSKLSADVASDKAMMQIMLNYQTDFVAASTALNAAGSVASGGIAAATGSPDGAINGAISAVTSCAAVPFIISRDTGITQAQQGIADQKFDHAQDNIRNIATTQCIYENLLTQYSNIYTEDTVNRFSDTNGINNKNIADDKTAADKNAADIQATNNTNAVATQNTNNANAGRTNNTETNNADWTRDATVAAEKANLVQKQLEAENMYKNARLQRPAEYSSYGGDYMPDVYQRRGVRLNIRTQTKAAISQAGDAFLRFGYALHRVWDMSQGFHYCKNFTFWKAEDIWINDGSGVANVATNIIGDILLKGVTVWRDPEKIGTVGIYDNI